MHRIECIVVISYLLATYQSDESLIEDVLKSIVQRGEDEFLVFVVDDILTFYDSKFKHFLIPFFFQDD